MTINELAKQLISHERDCAKFRNDILQRLAALETVVSMQEKLTWLIAAAAIGHIAAGIAGVL